MTNEELYDRLDETIKQTAKTKQITIDKLDQCRRLYNVPESVISDYIYGLADIHLINPDLLRPIAAVWLDDPDLAKGYKYKPKTTLVRFEPVIQVAENQWLTTIGSDDLIDLYDSGKIRYNPETQRPMRRTVRGETEIYHFYKNDQAIDEMCYALQKGQFIPNTITLNVLKDGFEGDISGYYLDNRYLDISDLQFDLLDGYHRFLALKKAFVLTPGFWFRMELRITNFTLREAHQFIFQEDQKTKMTKVQSASFNPNNLGNQVVGYLKQDNDFGSLISRNNGNIDESFLVTVITNIYFRTKPRTQSEEMIARNNAAKELQRNFRELVYSDSTLLDKKWERDYIIAAVWCSQNYKGINFKERVDRMMQDKGDRQLHLKGYTRGKIVNYNSVKEAYAKGGE